MGGGGVRGWSKDVRLRDIPQSLNWFHAILGCVKKYLRRALFIWCEFRFVTKTNGVLYEDAVIQIGYKLETRANLARLGMFYGNKMNSSFTEFYPSVSCPGALSSQLIVQVSVFHLLPDHFGLDFYCFRFSAAVLKFCIIRQFVVVSVIVFEPEVVLLDCSNGTFVLMISLPNILTWKCIFLFDFPSRLLYWRMHCFKFLSFCAVVCMHLPCFPWRIPAPGM